MSDKIFSLFSFRFYIGFIAALGVLSNTLVLPALPTIGIELGAGTEISVWTMTSFLLGSTLGQFCWGPISDAYGRRLPLYWGLLIVLGSCVGGFFSETMTQIIVARFFQGMGASSGNTLARAVSRDCYTGKAFEKMIALIFTIIPLTSGFSPLIGGILQSSFGWRSCFLFLFLLAFFLMIVTFFLLRPLPRFYGHFSLGKMAGEYRLILSSPQNIWILLSIGGIFFAHFAFLTGFPYLLSRFYDLKNWFVSILFMIFPLGTFGGGFYQFVWGCQKPIQKNLSMCWTIVFLAIFSSLATLMINEKAILVYLAMMMFFGGCTSIINSISCSFLLRRNKPSIVGALSSIIGVMQTLAAAIGSFLASLATSPLLSIVLLTAGVLCCFLFYRQIEWGTKETFSDLEPVLS